MKHYDIKIIFGILRCITLIVQLILFLTHPNMLDINIVQLYSPLLVYILLLIDEEVVIKAVEHEYKKGNNNGN